MLKSSSVDALTAALLLLFAPTEAYFARSWPLPDIEEVKEDRVH
jgi:hypothetical protein